MASDNWISSSDTAWSTTGNWSLSAVPVSTNNVYMSANYSVVSVLSGLAQSAVTLASLNIDSSYTGLIGTAQALGTATAYLNIGATTFNLGTPSINAGNGSRRLNINAANSGAIVNVLSTGSTANDSGYTPLLLLGTALVLNCTGGITGVALNVGDTASVATLNMTVGSAAPTVILGAGCTLTTGNVIGGTLQNFSAAASTCIVRANGALTHGGTGGYTALTIADGRTVTYNGTGTITSLIFAGPGTIDFSQGTGAVTVTNYTLYPGAKIIDPLHRVTYTNQPTTTYVKQTQVS